MTATADIVVEERDDVVMVPSQAVIRSSASTELQVAVKKTDGEFELRDVVLGRELRSNVEVKQGLKSGEQVAVDVPALFRRRADRLVRDRQGTVRTWPHADPP